MTAIRPTGMARGRGATSSRGLLLWGVAFSVALAASISDKFWVAASGPT
jgi:hypothetical protein